VLVPTTVEAAALDAGGAPIEVCGFGLAAAGVGAMAAIARYRPSRVVLAGVAGSYDADRARPSRPGASGASASERAGRRLPIWASRR
jgi:hypothetical protein